jgi:hypothetical protein
MRKDRLQEIVNYKKINILPKINQLDPAVIAGAMANYIRSGSFSSDFNISNRLILIIFTDQNLM